MTNNIEQLFRAMADRARDELFKFTKSTVIQSNVKPDKTLVTSCDLAIDEILSSMAKDAGFPVVSEEGEASESIIRKGTYITIDPIDGTLGYLHYVQDALSRNAVNEFGAKDLGPEYDFTLLLGYVNEGKACFGGCFNYITNEIILIDGSNPSHFKWENKKREYKGKCVAYVDPRPGDSVEDEIRSVQGVSVITQATLGLKSLYTFIGQHESAIACHRVQVAGLWDILPAATAARAFGGTIYDDQGNELVLNQYAILPGRGATILKGPAFKFVVDRLKEKARSTKSY